ncbi:crossover junction endodeoxyribonuclease RuvC [Limnochorda pilosa]|uniref:Crossover junction endodeoxyribonuclease RuvC n=1 Tax=Limnochorda pilosa TaxID=1555112 RepID=A0A0K2SNC0_LIMPI|nr:crossover junction endodeoxyribonuclease RuvC [Limnochorda pilosa]BAS28319.1 Holliday junction resolvase [Limnochorda pilosa]
MRVAGIDPGLGTTGFALVLSEGGRLSAGPAGVFRTPPGEESGARLLALHRQVRGFLQEERPDVMAVEELFFNRNITTGIQVAQARGVCLLAAAEAGVPVAEYNPQHVKVAVTGTGAADKHQVIYMVRGLLRLDRDPSPDDVADAMAVAICHAHTGGRGQ